MSETERLLSYALAPVEPPGALAERLELTLAEVTASAAEELADWELRAMRDPRNWARPVAAVVIGGAAGAALVVLQARQRQRQRGGLAGGARALERRSRELAGGVRARLRR